MLSSRPIRKQDGMNAPDRPHNRLIAAAPLYVQIAEGLLERIESGELAPGDRLPTEPDARGQSRHPAPHLAGP